MHVVKGEQKVLLIAYVR